MEVGVEISQKIRSAIKAKLMELGSYVDDELPDYIMVMVANKKNRAQMAGDLGLFLGGNTDVFTEWLSSLLVKLQAINADSESPVKLDKEKEEKSKKKKDKSGEKSKKKKDKGDSSKSKKDKKKDKKSDSKKKKADKSAPIDVVQTDKEGKKDPVVTDIATSVVTEAGDSLALTKTVLNTSEDKLKCNDTVVEEAKNVPEEIEVEDVRQLLVTESTTDALAEELETTEVETIPVKESRTVKVASLFAENDKEDEPKPSVILKSGRRLSRSKSHSPERKVETSRKRKAPTVLSSVVGARITSEDEEEYDPRNPSVGAVASVIKVTGRKSSVAPALQANRALLMKAMGEAERSIAVKRKGTISRHDARAGISSSRSDPRAESYEPKRREPVAKVRGTVHRDEAPPPYIPTKKARVSLSRRDARHVIDREEENDQILQARRNDLLRSIGVDREARKVIREDVLPGERHDPKYGKIQNFQITARVVNSPDETVKDVKVTRRRSRSPQKRKSDGGGNSTSQAKGTMSARLGKVMKRSTSAGEPTQDGSERSRSFEPDEERPQKVASIEKVKVTKTVAKERKGGVKMDMSSFAKELVNKQCRAAVKSVKAAETAEKAKVIPDSRVVCRDGEDDDVIHVERDDRETVRVQRVRSAERVQSEDRDDVRVKRAKSEDRESVRSNRSHKEASLRRQDNNESPEDLSRLLDDSHNDFTLDLEDEDLSHLVEDDLKDSASKTQGQGDKGTRFIVTLDGVDEKGDYDDKKLTKQAAPMSSRLGSQLPMDLTLRENVVYDALAAQATPPHPVLHHPPPHYAPPKVQPFSISLQDSDDEQGKMDTSLTPYTAVTSAPYVAMEQGQAEPLTALQKAKSFERCRFWPACAAGAGCEFHHPTTHCKTFPGCKFGDKCLFIHPNCRFDSKCARADCPYTHTSKRSGLGAPHAAAIPPPPQAMYKPSPSAYLAYPSSYPPSGYPASATQQPCRFYPNCHNVNCTFYHPRPCRFGMACRTPNCMFVHPEVALPGKDKLKWTAQAPASQVPAVTKVPSTENFITLAKFNYQEVVEKVKVVPAVSSVPAKVSEGSGVSSTSQ